MWHHAPPEPWLFPRADGEGVKLSAESSTRIPNCSWTLWYLRTASRRVSSKPQVRVEEWLILFEILLRGLPIFLDLDDVLVNPLLSSLQLCGRTAIPGLAEFQILLRDLHFSSGFVDFFLGFINLFLSFCQACIAFLYELSVRPHPRDATLELDWVCQAGLWVTPLLSSMFREGWLRISGNKIQRRCIEDGCEVKGLRLTMSVCCKTVLKRKSS